MCVIFWTTNDPHYDLVIASNRDEFLSRPTLPATWHDFSTSSSSSSSQPHVLSARDSTGGGTWLGITRNGSFATLTNFTELSAPLPPGMDAFESRGRLVRDWLSQPHSGGGREEVEERVWAYLTRVGEKGDRFPGFNLLVGGLSTSGTVVGYITNRTATGEVVTGRMPDIFPPQSHDALPTGMSNSILSSPWVKVNSGSKTFHNILSTNHNEEGSVESLFDLLWTSSTPKPAQRSELRNSVLISPLQLPAAAGEGSDWYATRTSTVILVGKDGHAKFVERDTFRREHGEAVRVNGPEGSGAVKGRSGGQRVFEWQIA